MEAQNFVSLAVIVIAAFVCPILVQIIPRKVISETVLLLIAGMVFGPYMLNIIQPDDALDFLNDLGLGFLFLLAGYEIDPKIITGHQGRRGLLTWLFTFAFAFLVVMVWPTFSAFSTEGVIVTIALSTTAIGTLLPILQERGILATDIGQSILSYGTWGELCPVFAITILLSSRAEWLTILILAAFVLISILAAILPKHARKAGNFIFTFIVANAETNAQMIVRATVMLMVGITALSAIFNLDIVLGAFAAGFILRYIIPEGNDAMENKLHAIAFGFFIPLFFIYSGIKIDISAIGEQPSLLIMFILLLVFVRALPIFVALRLDKETRNMSARSRFTVAIYCTTALPLIVAVTAVGVDINAMSETTASILVAAGGITVLIMPIIGQAALRTIDADLPTAVQRIREGEGSASTVLKEHRRLEVGRHKADVQAHRERVKAIRRRRMQSDLEVEQSQPQPYEQVLLTPFEEENAKPEIITIAPEPVDAERDALTAALDEQRQIEEAEEALERARKSKANDTAHSEESEE